MLLYVIIFIEIVCISIIVHWVNKQNTEVKMYDNDKPNYKYQIPYSLFVFTYYFIILDES